MKVRTNRVKIADFPAPIQRLVATRIDPLTKPHNEEVLYLVQAFTWHLSEEGFDFWADINTGNFQVFYDKYPEHAPKQITAHPYPEDEENEEVQSFVNDLDKSFKSCLLYFLIATLICAIALAFKSNN